MLQHLPLNPQRLHVVHLTLKRSEASRAACFIADSKTFQCCRNWAVIKIASSYLSQGDVQLSFCDAEIYFIIICRGQAGPCTHHWLFLLGQIVKVRVPAAFYGCLTFKTDCEAAAEPIYFHPRQSVGHQPKRDRILSGRKNQRIKESKKNKN